MRAAPALCLAWERTGKSNQAKGSGLPPWASLGKPLCSFGPQAGHVQDGPIINYDMTTILTNTDIP